MKFVNSQPITPAADIRELVREAGPTPAESKKIAEVRTKIKVFNDYAHEHLSKKTASDRGIQCPLQTKIWEAASAFAASPSPETARVLTAACAAYHAGEAVQDAFFEVGNNEQRRLSLTLAPLCQAMIDRAVDTMRQQLAAAQIALDGAPGLRTEAKNFSARVDASERLADEQRRAAEADPLSWLSLEIGF